MWIINHDKHSLKSLSCFHVDFCYFKAFPLHSAQPWATNEWRSTSRNTWATLSTSAHRDSRNISWSLIRLIKCYVLPFILWHDGGKSMTACKNLLLCRSDLATQIKSSQAAHTVHACTHAHEQNILWYFYLWGDFHTQLLTLTITTKPRTRTYGVLTSLKPFLSPPVVVRTSKNVLTRRENKRILEFVSDEMATEHVWRCGTVVFRCSSAGFCTPWKPFADG